MPSVNMISSCTVLHFFHFYGAVAYRFETHEVAFDVFI